MRKDCLSPDLDRAEKEGIVIRRKPLVRRMPLKGLSTLRRSKSRTNYRKRLWDIFSKYIRLKYADEAGNVVCVSCGEVKHWKSAHAGHYIPKSLGLSIYFEERNVHPQCPGCNKWRHGNLAPYALFLLKTYGPTILEELDAKQRTFEKISEWRYLELIAEYQGKLKALGFKEAA